MEQQRGCRCWRCDPCPWCDRRFDAARLQRCTISHLLQPGCGIHRLGRFRSRNHACVVLPCKVLNEQWDARDIARRGQCIGSMCTPVARGGSLIVARGTAERACVFDDWHSARRGNRFSRRNARGPRVTCCCLCIRCYLPRACHNRRSECCIRRVQVYLPEWSGNGWIAAVADGRAAANLRQANHLGTLLLWSCVALVWLVESKGLVRWLAVALAVFMVFGLVLTASRTATLGVVALGIWGALDARVSRATRRGLLAAPLLYAFLFWALSSMP